MPNAVTETGLVVKTQQDVTNEILNGTPDYPGYYQIYGPDINVGPNSPDGQQINIVVQAVMDVLELLNQIFTSFDPDQAMGTVLDQRCAINGVLRRGATYTQQVVQVTVTQALTLPGLDTAPTAPFTVSDNAGNQFQLVNAYSFGGAGTQSLTFQAAVLGPVQTVIGTITQIVTTTLGVSGVNNSAAAASLGIAEETDSDLRIRRANSVSLPSRGYLEGLIGALLDTDGVDEAIVFENNTNATDGNGIPSHSIWCIVLGGANADIADAIYRKRNAGCGMKGAVVVAVPQIDGSTMNIKFDRPTAETLWITFNATAITGAIDTTFIRTQLLALLSYRIGQSADTTTIVALIKQIAPNASVDSEGVSNTNGSYTTLKAPTGVNYQFGILSARIIINGVPG